MRGRAVRLTSGATGVATGIGMTALYVCAQDNDLSLGVADLSKEPWADSPLPDSDAVEAFRLGYAEGRRSGGAA